MAFCPQRPFSLSEVEGHVPNPELENREPALHPHH